MEQLFKMNNADLENSLGLCIRKERGILYLVIEHIKEVSRRDLHLERGYSSLKDYLVKKWGYSEQAAYRRIDAANLLKQVPSLVEKIKDGSMDINKIGERTRAVKEKERVSGEKVSPLMKTELVALISGKTGKESQRDLARALDIQLKEFEIQRVQKDESVRLEITISKELSEKLSCCRDLAVHLIQQQNKDHSLASVIEVLADQYLRSKNACTDLAKIKTSKENVRTKSTGSEHVNKTLTRKIRNEILQRDRCCQYKDPSSGKLCGTTFAAQVDHKTSQWAGGNHAKNNLQIFCASHNRYKYRRESQLRLI